MNSPGSMLMPILERSILTSPRIIRVEPTTPMVSLTWMIGSRCNYDCMYCPSELHDMTSSHPDLNKLTSAWVSLYNKTQHLNLPYKLSFTGGEVTANKQFLPLIEYLKSNYNIGQITVTTNGSASINYYTRLAGLVDSISFSTHSEFFNEQEFFDKVSAINKLMPRPEKSVHVNVMDEYWNRDRIAIYTKWLEKNMISYSVNTLDYSKQIRNHPELKGVYNLEQV
jgi:MoaA/NifB/PqqE/SkfB family radical SAM enzyme